MIFPSPSICIYPMPSGPATCVTLTDFEVAPEQLAVTVAVLAATGLLAAVNLSLLNVKPPGLVVKANVGVAFSLVAVPVLPDV